MVDEFQDTNGLQLGLIEQLRGPDTRVFMVGDEFQSIYGFRHADVDVYRRQQRRFAGGRGAERRVAAADRQLPRRPRAARRHQRPRRRAARRLRAADRAAATTAAGGGDPAVELLLTVDDKKGWEDPDDRAAAACPTIPAPPPRSPRRAGWPAACASWSTRARTPRRSSCCCGPSPTSTRWSAPSPRPGSTPTWSAAAASGPSSRSRTCAACWPSSPTRSTTSRCSARSPRPPARSSPTRSGCCAGPPARSARTAARRHLHIWPLLRDLAEDGEPSRGDPEAAALIPPEELERLRGFVATLNGLRRRGAEDGLESLVERVASAFDYDLATLVRDSGEARWANVRKLMRLAREFEAREGPDLTAFLDYLANRAARTRPRGRGRDPGRGPRRGPRDDRAQREGPGVRRGRRRRHGPQPPDRLDAAAPGAGRGRARQRRGQPGGHPARAARAARGAPLRLLRARRPGRRPRGRGGGPPGLRRGDAGQAAAAAERHVQPEGAGGRAAPAQADREPADPHAARRRDGRARPGAAGRGRRLPGRADARDGQRARAGGRGELLAERPAPEPEPAAHGGRAARSAGRRWPPLPPAPSPTRRCPTTRRAATASTPSGCSGIAGGDAAMAPDPTAGEEAHADPEARRRFGPGLAVHALLEWSSEHRWTEPDAERVAAALREQGLPDGADQVDHALELVRGWLGSELRGELDDAKTSPEVPFVLSLAETPIRGSIDLLADRGDRGTLVVDYKTDRLDGREPEQLAGRYRVQRELYALAAAERGASGRDRLRLPRAARRAGAPDLRSGRARRGARADRGPARAARRRRVRRHPESPSSDLPRLPRARAPLLPRARGPDARRPRPADRARPPQRAAPARTAEDGCRGSTGAASPRCPCSTDGGAGDPRPVRLRLAGPARERGDDARPPGPGGSRPLACASGSAAGRSGATT